VSVWEFPNQYIFFFLQSAFLPKFASKKQQL